jgi:small subunit ribosomal protein S18
MEKKPMSKPAGSVVHHCYFCMSGTNFIDHKNVELLNRFISYNGKIKPRRISNVCAKHQRLVANAIKRARLIALIPFVKE